MTTGFRSRSLPSSPSREDLGPVVLGRQRRQGESGRGPLTADALRGVAVTPTEGQRDSLPTPSRSIAVGRHASIPRLRPHLLISSALREAHWVGPRARRSTPPTAPASAGSAAIFRRWASSLSNLNQ